MSKRFSFLFFLFCSVVIYAKENQKNSHQTEKNHTIPPVIVKAQKQNFEINDQKIIITHEQISTSGTTTLANVLQNLGGVQLQDITGNGSQVALSMRGFGVNSSSNTLLLINGIPITNPDLAPPDLNAIPLQEIKSIEIIAGSESVLYGDQAVGGVVNIITQQETIKKMFFVCDAGSFSTKNCSFTFNNQAGHLGYHFNLLSEKTNNYREHNDYTQNLFSGQLNYPYSRGKVSLDYHIANEFMQYPGALTEQQVHENRRQASNNTDFFRDNNYYLHLHQTQHFDNHWQLTTDISTRNMQGNGVLFSPFTQSRTTYFIRPTLKKSLNDTNFLYGIDLEKDRYQLNSAFGLNKDSQEKYGLFGMLNVPFKEKIIFYGGLRGALQHNHLVTNTTSYPVNRAFVSSIGASYQVDNTMNFYINRAGNFRFPKADEDASTNTNQGLKTQKGVSYEAGIKKNTDQYSGKINIYLLNLVNEITFDPTQTPDHPWGTNRNLPPTTRQGASVSFTNKMTDQLSFGGQYNAVNAKFQSGVNKGNRIPLVSENILLAHLNYQCTENWAIYSEAVFTGSQYPANDDANVNGTIGGYTTYNMNFRYHKKWLEVSFRINNIFNKYYYFYTVYTPGLDTESLYPAPGRSMVITVKYEII